MSLSEHHLILSAGNSDDGTIWLDVTTGQLSYENYLAILEMLFDEMRDDLDLKLNDEKFQSAIRDLTSG
ncbi:hypothetical protein [Lacticaseibacillus hegangensis]|uniref:Uncharacterized protein n=1 Tax=Lacticaseibacillus hegangensis TaxID=2486010 RepID=A0ABW4D0S6_9LACO|nr:hypothetical protein [Lacticaseibacillus hegangensis]